MSETGPLEAPRDTRSRWRGCLIPALLALLAVIALPCCLLMAIIVAAAAPEGFAIGSDETGFTAELRPTHFSARLYYQEFGPDSLCYREESLTILFDPLEVRRVPGCQCAVPGPDFSRQLEPCWPD